jgi:hypothetical protein
MNWLEMTVSHGIRPLIPVLMLVILPHHLQTLEGMAMCPLPKILFEFEKDDTFLKRGSLLVKQYERRKIWVYMYVLRTHLLHPSSYVFERRSPERLFIPAIEKDTCRKIWWGVYTLDRMLALAPIPRSAPTWFMCRLMRSVTDRATPVREDRNVENAARAPSDPALPIDDARRVSIDNIYQREALTRLAFGNPATVTTTTVHEARIVGWQPRASPLRHVSECMRQQPPVFCVLHCHLRRPFRDHGTKTRHRRALAHHQFLGPQQTAWSVHAPARMGFSRDAPRLASALAILHVTGIVASAWVAERTRE